MIGAMLSLGLASCVTVTIDRPGDRKKGAAPQQQPTSASPGIFEDGAPPILQPDGAIQPGTTGGPPPLDPNKPLYKHAVVAGDSLWKLSRDYQTSISDIQAANGMEGVNVLAGETILIPTNTPPPGAVAEPRPEPAPKAAPVLIPGATPF